MPPSICYIMSGETKMHTAVTPSYSIKNFLFTMIRKISISVMPTTYEEQIQPTQRIHKSYP